MGSSFTAYLMTFVTDNTTDVYLMKHLLMIRCQKKRVVEQILNICSFIPCEYLKNCFKIQQDSS